MKKCIASCPKHSKEPASHKSPCLHSSKLCPSIRCSTCSIRSLNSCTRHSSGFAGTLPILIETIQKNTWKTVNQWSANTRYHRQKPSGRHPSKECVCTLCLTTSYDVLWHQTLSPPGLSEVNKAPVQMLLLISHGCLSSLATRSEVFGRNDPKRSI